MEAIKSVTISGVLQEVERVNIDAERLLRAINEIPETEFDRALSVPVVEVLTSLATARCHMTSAIEHIREMLLEYRSVRRYLVSFDYICEELRNYLLDHEVAPFEAGKITDEFLEALLLSYTSTGVATINRNVTGADLPNGDEVLQLPHLLTRSVSMVATQLLAVVPDGVWSWKRNLDLPGYQLEITVAEVVENGSGTGEQMVTSSQRRRNRKSRSDRQRL